MENARRYFLSFYSIKKQANHIIKKMGVLFLK
ncbi:hypothetical protein LCGC14_1980660, partial [marine sediment metagenome]